MAAQDVQATEPGPVVASGLLLVGGRARCRTHTEDGNRRAREVLGRILQVRHLAVMLGAGTSFHLGSPQIRNLNASAIRGYVEEAGGSLSADAAALLDALVPDADADLEALLALLGSGIAYASRVGLETLSAPGGSHHSLDAFRSLATGLNRALAFACDLPRLAADADAALSADPLSAHREFFRRLLRGRRGDLPRARVFTTNYDLLIELALDSLRVTYFDGFTGTVDRVFSPRAFDQEVFVPASAGDRRILRVEQVLHLYKLHGSVNWRVRAAVNTASSSIVVQVPRGATSGAAAADERVLVYPTPYKETDTLAYPYADLFRTFSAVLSEQETALVVVGYSFSDDHLNRMIYQALQANPTLQLFVIAPYGVLRDEMFSTTCDDTGDEIKCLPSALGRLAAVHDERISVFTGTDATFENVARNLMPDPDGFGGGPAQADGTSLGEALLGPPRTPPDT